MGRGRDEVGELTKRLRQQSISAAAESKELAAVHIDLESRKAKADFLDEALAVCWKEVTEIKAVVDDQKA